MQNAVLAILAVASIGKGVLGDVEIFGYVTVRGRV